MIPRGGARPVRRDQFDPVADANAQLRGQLRSDGYAVVKAVERALLPLGIGHEWVFKKVGSADSVDIRRCIAAPKAAHHLSADQRRRIGDTLQRFNTRQNVGVIRYR